jgi:hypothetical protein
LQLIGLLSTYLLDFGEVIKLSVANLGILVETSVNTFAMTPSVKSSRTVIWFSRQTARNSSADLPVIVTKKRGG